MPEELYQKPVPVGNQPITHELSPSNPPTASTHEHRTTLIYHKVVHPTHAMHWCRKEHRQEACGTWVPRSCWQLCTRTYEHTGIYHTSGRDREGDRVTLGTDSRVTPEEAGA